MQTNPSQVFRESDIIPIELQEKSLFMKNWMEPIGLYWAVGVLVDYEDVHYASLFLYRAKDKQPFSDKELEILRVVDDHPGRRCTPFSLMGSANCLWAKSVELLVGLCFR